MDRQRAKAARHARQDALLEARRTEKGGAPRASLVVAPRSLLFNWKREAERFAPALRVAEYHGSGRDEVLSSLDGFDLVLTTYGTMRRDAAALSGAEFDYVVLDEAQAIKNAATAAAKATRLLRARHRLALSGTPIENQLGDLWSLFEFLNPGLLGTLQHGLFASELAAHELFDLHAAFGFGLDHFLEFLDGRLFRPPGLHGVVDIDVDLGCEHRQGKKDQQRRADQSASPTFRLHGFLRKVLGGKALPTLKDRSTRPVPPLGLA